ncbi:IclR family transcriptional regulator [uncultured Propionibacterium sp.]|uniref:IclR family transcriptional regulator n=1 Tax=uncultured Propionibacterium sp. TaxID=218066 RepID=UPI002930D293|nr:IclR family transcriptional regulator [uncultured Propionibacterium sp.]
MTSTPDAAGGVRDVKSAGRTIELLEFLAGRQARPPRLNEIAQALDAPRSSVYAIIRTLQARGWVQASPPEGYSLGIRALTAGTSYIDADPHVRIVRPLLTDLATRFDETFHLGRIDSHHVVYLVTQESRQDIRTYSRVGRRMPATATGLGKALLAERPELIPVSFERLTPRSITDAREFAQEMRRTRSRGYAVDDEESTIGLRCIAFALPYAAPVTDAISCSLPVSRATQERQAEIVAAMRMAVERAVSQAPLRP